MKRFWKILTAVLALSLVLCAGAAAADFDAVAGELNAIGMFRGTGDSFELDRAPTRAEAAIMLVRLYGAEEQATADYASSAITHPFSDVPAWCAPHVAWLYSEGLTKGMTATTFGSTDTCSAQNYVTFLLRALGYQDGADFDYSAALDFSQEKGFYDPMLFSGEFLRDDLAAVTYQALAADVKDGSGSLLSSLVSSGAVDAEAAKPLMEKMELFRQVIHSGADSSDAVDVETTAKMDISMSTLGFSQFVGTSSVSRATIDASGSEPLVAYTETSNDGTGETTSGMWVKDGWVYLSPGEAPLAMQFKYPVGDMELTQEVFTLAEAGSLEVNGLSMVKSITAAKSGSDTVYTMIFDGKMGGMMDIVTDLVGDVAVLTSLEVTDITATYTVGRDGVLKSARMVFSADVSMEIPDEETGIALPVSAHYDYDVTTTILATGDDVKITFPDFSNYIEIDPSLLEG